ncbi:MAG TPA: hypothetical protein VHN99_00195 [Deinococcales bacterium]|nr:hypothetical protein [Deinococcales bacterium]
MKFAVVFLVLASLAVSPLPGIPAIPEGSEVQVVRDDSQSFVAIGVVNNAVLLLNTRGVGLSPNELVKVWFLLANKATKQTDQKIFAGRVTPDGNDILLEPNDRVSLREVLQKVYKIELRLDKRR